MLILGADLPAIRPIKDKRLKNDNWTKTTNPKACRVMKLGVAQLSKTVPHLTVHFPLHDEETLVVKTHSRETETRTNKPERTKQKCMTVAAVLIMVFEFRYFSAIMSQSKRPNRVSINWLHGGKQPYITAGVGLLQPHWLGTPDGWWGFERERTHANADDSVGMLTKHFYPSGPPCLSCHRTSVTLPSFW